MSLQADIQWVQNEVGKVTNPRLIEAFKSLLLYREEKIEASTSNDWVKKRLTEAALSSEEDIKAERVYTREEVEKGVRTRLGL